MAPTRRRGRLVPAVIDALLAGEDAKVTTGEQIRDFMHVEDAAAAIVHVLETDALAGPVNVASGRPVTVRQVVETIATILGKARSRRLGSDRVAAERPTVHLRERGKADVERLSRAARSRDRARGHDPVSQRGTNASSTTGE